MGAWANRVARLCVDAPGRSLPADGELLKDVGRVFNHELFVHMSVMREECAK